MNEIFVQFGSADGETEAYMSKNIAEDEGQCEERNRGPLLLISGAQDNTVSPELVRSTFKAYRKSKAVTELKEFARWGHSLTIDSGWRELAENCLDG